MLSLIVAFLSGCDRSVEGETNGPVSRTPVERWIAGGLAERGGVVLAGLPSGGAMSPRGLVAVADRAGSKIRLIGPKGEPVRELGRRGVAPGEFRQLDQVGFRGDTLLWASDAGSGWITWFDLRRPDSVWTVPAPEEQVPRTPWTAKPTWALAGGQLLAKPRRAGSRNGSTELPPIPVVTWSPEGDLRVAGMVDNTAPRSLQVRMGSGLFGGTSQMIEGAPVIGMAAGGRWFFVLDRTPASADTGLIRIHRFDPDGRQIDRLEIPYRPEPVGDSIVKWIHARAEWMAEALWPGRGIEAEDVLEGTWIPEQLPPVREILADEEGFWILREMTSPGLWERYDLEGRLKFAVRLPPSFRGLAGSANVLFGWMVDSLHVPELRFYEITDGDTSETRSPRTAAQAPDLALELVRFWHLEDLPTPRGGVLTQTGTAIVWSGEGDLYRAAPADSTLSPITEAPVDLVLAPAAPSAARQDPLAISRTDGSVLLASAGGAPSPLSKSCPTIRNIVSALRTAADDGLLAVVPRPSTGGVAVLSIRLHEDGCERLAGTTLRCNYGSPSLATATDSSWVVACPDPAAPLFLISSRGRSLAVETIRGSIPDSMRISEDIRGRQARWLGLPILRIQGGFMRVVSDLRSDVRRFEFWDEAGRHVGTEILHDPIGFAASSPDGGRLLGMRGRSLVVYELTRSEEH